MIAACREGALRAPGTVGGWWRAAARMIALVLALALAMPAAGLAEDLSFHRHGHGHHGSELALDGLGAVASAAPRAADPGLACHAHCGCHVAAAPCEAGLVPPDPAPRPRYARTRETVSSLGPDRLPRPPRA